ncbi:MAG: glutamate--tRNA ligase [Pseudomonadota bacterium]
MSKTVVTRFAPSPTGFLHIGGARTALFNWLYAKANNGKMLLRIEDTDRARSSREAVDAIIDGLSWLGLDWDSDPISQYANADRHREIANAMVENGTAYRCYNKDDDGHADGSFVIRVKAPKEGETVVEDQVQGTVRFPNKDLDDFVLLRSDGNPTYMLAVVVDDHDMGVTHIIRGDDHLTNAARQTLIFNAMSWEVPVMAHIPLIHGADGAKLSKRHGAIGAEAYRAMGYLPDALRNYLVRLGWSHGDDEIMSTQQMIEWFGFEGMNKAAARFDFAKLEAINAHYLREMPEQDLLDALCSVASEIEGGTAFLDPLPPKLNAWVLRALPSLKSRAKTMADLAQGAAFLFAERPLFMEEKAANLLTEEARSTIAEIILVFETLGEWDHDSIDDAIRSFAEERGMKLGQVAQPIRAALTGKGTSPGAFDVLQILGREESVERLKDQL